MNVKKLNIIKNNFAACVLVVLLFVPIGSSAETSLKTDGFVNLTDVIPEIIVDLRYSSSYNFVGIPIRGYNKPVAITTLKAANALKCVNDELMKKGYVLKIYDAYRPQMAVDHFVEWAKNTSDIRMKDYFYPNIDKKDLFSLDYIAYKSGHSKGSTIDLTIFDNNNNCELDMGGTFDFFGECSHIDYNGITSEQKHNRMYLQSIMRKYGFRGLYSEWWHFTLEDEPFPNTYFNFPIDELVLEKK